MEAVENYFALGGRKKSQDVNKQQFVSYNTYVWQQAKKKLNPLFSEMF